MGKPHKNLLNSLQLAYHKLEVVGFTFNPTAYYTPINRLIGLYSLTYENNQNNKVHR